MSGWIKVIGEGRPDKPVFIFWRDSYGQKHVGRGYYVEKYECVASDYLNDWSDDQVDYVEADDEWYLLQGWYEDTGSGEFFNYLGDSVTHWQPIEYPE